MWTWNIWGDRTEYASKQWEMATFASNCSVKMTLRLFYPLSVVMTMVPRLLRKFRRSLQIKKNARKCSLCVITYWIAKIYLSINNSEKWLVTGIPLTLLQKLLKLHREKSSNWPMVSFIHNGREITTWMGHSFKTKSTKSKATVLRWQRLFWISSCRSLN